MEDQQTTDLKKVCRHFEKMIFEISKLPDEEALIQMKVVLDSFSPDFRKKIVPSILRRCSRYLIPYVLSVAMTSSNSSSSDDFSLPFSA